MLVKTIPLLIAYEIRENGHMRLYRNLTYRFRQGTDFDRDTIDPRDEEERENGYNILEIYRFLKTKTRQIVSTVPAGNETMLLSNLLHVEELYSEVPKMLASIQTRAPRLLIRIYERIENLIDEIELEHSHYTQLNSIDVIQRLDNALSILREAEIKIMAFWINIPEFFIRLPVEITQAFLSPQLFLSAGYFPYIMREIPLPEWTDPLIIGSMNESIKIHQTKIQTLAQRREYMVLLSLIHKFPCEILSHVVDYLPINFTFDLLTSETLFEYFSRTHPHSYETSIYVS